MTSGFSYNGLNRPVVELVGWRHRGDACRLQLHHVQIMKKQEESECRPLYGTTRTTTRRLSINRRTHGDLLTCERFRRSNRLRNSLSASRTWHPVWPRRRTSGFPAARGHLSMATVNHRITMYYLPMYADRWNRFREILKQQSERKTFNNFFVFFTVKDSGVSKASCLKSKAMTKDWDVVLKEQQL